MWNCRDLGRLTLACLAGLSLPSVVQAETWASPLFHQELILLDKAPMGDSSSPRPLPARLQDRLGRDAVEYESFVAVRLPPDAAKEMMDAADAEGYSWLRDTRPPISLPFHSFAPEGPARSQDWEGRRLEPEPVSGLFIVQLAFPVLPEWLKDLKLCGVEEVTYYGNRTWLMRARSLEAIRRCGAARYLSWAGLFLTTDRLAADLLDQTGEDDFWLQFAAGTPKAAAEAVLPAGVEVLESFRWGEDGVLSLRVRATPADLEALAARPSGDLLTINRHVDETPSDERQGQIVAGNRTATAVTSPGYLTWLQNAGLRTAANQQTVCVMDLGYDDGLPTSGTQHPDLPTGARIVDSKSFVTGTAAVPDAFGHGTFVAGIIAGNGAGGTVDGQGFRSGLGIAPDAKLVIAQIRGKAAGSCGYTTSLTPTALGQVFDFCRVTTGGADKALIANYSHNSTTDYWDLDSILFDKRVIDGYALGSTEPLTIVVSAGNKGPAEKTVQSPATGRNVIAVGSTQSYRPSSQPGSPPLACTGNFAGFPTEQADDLSKVSSFSSRGRLFGPGTSATVLFTRVKPDLVAPGGRVMSTVPFQFQSQYSCQGLCRKYWLDPPSGNNYHSYTQGTSFAAPVISGMAALVRKWFLDRPVPISPSPAMVKAALIATSDDIGITDHRPSNASGWGLGNLQRATDTTARFYIDSISVSTGGYYQTVAKTIDDPTKGTFIVLVWSDATPGTLSTSPIAPLVNNLSLSVDRAGVAMGWRGNNFNEVLLGADDGYSYTYTFGGALDDTINTVEAVFLPPNTFTAGQQVVIRVTGIDVPSGPQRFAVYAYNVRP